ncbi:MAG: XRE family transcriptional regulator [Pseudomonadales bacterium]|nr:XRE family transcriptional regulator [Pseudomonadales bacterium]
MTNKKLITDITPANGNVFEDIGFDFVEAYNLKFRSEFAMILNEWIRLHEYTQKKAAEILGVSRPEISNLQRGKIEKISLDKLVNMTRRAGKLVQFQVTDVDLV